MYEAEDAATQGNTNTNTTETHVLVLEADSACENETDSLVKFLEGISDAGLSIKVQGKLFNNAGCSVYWSMS